MLKILRFNRVRGSLQSTIAKASSPRLRFGTAAKASSTLPPLDTEHKMHNRTRTPDNSTVAAVVHLMEYKILQTTGLEVELSTECIIRRCKNVNCNRCILDFLSSSGAMIYRDWPNNCAKPINEKGCQFYIKCYHEYHGGTEIAAGLQKDALVGSAAGHPVLRHYPAQGQVITFAHLRKLDHLRTATCKNTVCKNYGKNFLHFCISCGFVGEGRLGVVISGVSDKCWQITHPIGAIWGYNGCGYISRSGQISGDFLMPHGVLDIEREAFGFDLDASLFEEKMFRISHVPDLDVEHQFCKDIKKVKESAAHVAAILDIMAFHYKRQTGEDIRFSLKHVLVSCPNYRDHTVLEKFLQEKGAMSYEDWPDCSDKPRWVYGVRVQIKNLVCYYGPHIAAAVNKEPLVGFLWEHKALESYKGRRLTEDYLRNYDDVRVRDGMYKYFEGQRTRVDLQCSERSCRHYGEQHLGICRICGYLGSPGRRAIVLCGVGTNSFKFKAFRGKKWGTKGFGYIARYSYGEQQKILTPLGNLGYALWIQMNDNNEALGVLGVEHIAFGVELKESTN